MVNVVHWSSSFMAESAFCRTSLFVIARLASDVRAVHLELFVAVTYVFGIAHAKFIETYLSRRCEAYVIICDQVFNQKEQASNTPNLQGG